MDIASSLGALAEVAWQVKNTVDEASFSLSLMHHGLKPFTNDPLAF